ncbi:MAG: phage tail tape measure protein [Desulfovibrionaceae bacterium]|nr:phage tail tape measure protein [Desulfovibrionaceae bacterium]
MSNSANVEVRLSLNNTASKWLEQAQQQAQKSAERGAAAQRNATQRASQAREALGIRSERKIQQEIGRTRAAYQRLAQSGTMTWREQARAADQMRQKVTQLTNEMGRLTARQKARGALKIGASVAAGVGAAGYALSEPIRKGMSFEKRLAYLSNEAFQERDKAGRKQGKDELLAAVTAAQQSSGGSKDDLAQALDTLVSSNKMSVAEAAKMLPQIAKAATATGQDVDKLANSAVGMMEAMNVSADDIPNVLNMVAAGGHAGSFKLDKMLDALPHMLAQAKIGGMSGKGDIASVVALFQSLKSATGSDADATSGMDAIFRAMGDQNLARHLKIKTGKNLQKHLQSQRAKGVNSLDAFTGLIEESLGKDKNYQAMKAKLAAAGNDEERNQALEDMAAIAQRSGLGELVPNRKAMVGLLALMNNKGRMQDIRGNIMANDVAAGGAIDRDFESIKSESGFKKEQSSEALDTAQQGVLRGFYDSLGKITDQFTELATKYPNLIGGITLSVKALTALAGAAGIAAIAMGGKGILGRAGGGILRRIAGGAAARIAGGAAIEGIASRASAGISMAGVGKGALKMAGKGGIAAVGSIAGEYMLEKAFGEESAVTRYGSAALSGAGIGATIFSIIPGVGTAIGAAAGGAIGLISQGISDWLSSDKPEEAPKPEPKEVDINAHLQIGLAPGLVINKQEMRAEGGKVRMDTGNIYAGAPP